MTICLKFSLFVFLFVFLFVCLFSVWLLFAFLSDFIFPYIAVLWTGCPCLKKYKVINSNGKKAQTNISLEAVNVKYVTFFDKLFER